MAAISAATATATVTTIPSGSSAVLSSKESLQKQLADHTIAAMREIAQDTFNRMQGYQKDIKMLSEGIFYPQHYAEALKEKQQTKRLDWLLGKEFIHNGIAPKEYFRNSPCKTMTSGYVPNHFLLLPGKSASDAVQALRKGLAFLGCGEVCQVAQYAALIHVLTKEKFDAIFNDKECTGLSIGVRDVESPIRVLSEITSNAQMDKLKVGQVVHFRSIQGYGRKHPFGQSHGYNVICAEEGAEPKFIGFGLDPKNVTQAQITAELHSDYNKPPIDQAIFVSNALAMKLMMKVPSNIVEERQRLKTDTVTLAEFQKLGGGSLASQVVSLNVDRIAELVKADVSKCKSLMRKWYRELRAKS